MVITAIGCDISWKGGTFSINRKCTALFATNIQGIGITYMHVWYGRTCHTGHACMYACMAWKVVHVSKNIIFLPKFQCRLPHKCLAYHWGWIDVIKYWIIHAITADITPAFKAKFSEYAICVLLPQAGVGKIDSTLQWTLHATNSYQSEKHMSLLIPRSEI